MTETENTKQLFDLEDRTYKFARDCRNYIKILPKTNSNFEYSKQLLRSSGSQAANYIEANEALSKKDFLMRIKICRKESKESILWLNLTEPTKENDETKTRLIDEATQLMKIFGKIIRNSENQKV